MTIPNTPTAQTNSGEWSTYVEAILHDISDTLLPHPGLNERYIHHEFSHRLQTVQACLDIATPHSTLLLHPEWPTFKKATKLAFAKYRKTVGGYMPVDLEGDGSAGFIDFAIGFYPAPEIGVEFSLKKGWGHEEVVYDFLKLIDRRNPIKVVFSHNIIIRENNLTMFARRQDLEDHINRALAEAIHRLDSIGYAVTRDVRLTVSEIATHERRHWHYDQVRKLFVEGRGSS